MTIRNKTCIDLLRFKKNNPLIFWLVVLYLTFLFIYSLIFLSFYADHNKAMALNELGDFLAGSFSPLAFLFLYLGYKQQGKELRQNTKALNMQAEELRISNKSLSQQVAEMEKSVKAQQDMFELAEKQYHNSENEKHKSTIPKYMLITSGYKEIKPTGSIDGYDYKFNLKIKNLNIPLANIAIKSNFWCITSASGFYDDKQIFKVPLLDVNSEVSLIIYKNRTRDVPFKDNTLSIELNDYNGKKYTEIHNITKTDTDQIYID